MSKQRLSQHQNHQNLPHRQLLLPPPLSMYPESGSKQQQQQSVAMHMGDGWCTFPDLDNFDADKLLRALTLKVG